MPRSAPSAASLNTALTSSTVVSRATVAVRSVADPGGTRPAQVAVRTVLKVLIGRVGVDRRHQAALDAERVVEDLRHRREAVGGAGRVGNDRVPGRVVVAVIDPEDDGE